MTAISEQLAKQRRCPHMTNAPGGQGLCVGAQCMMWRWTHDIRRIVKPKAISNIGREALLKETSQAVKEGFVVVKDGDVAVTLLRQTDQGFCGLAGRVAPDYREAADE